VNRRLSEQEPTPPRLALFVAAFGLACFVILAVGDAPTPILHDMVEAYVWGQQFELGYHQHPPFWAWVCGVWFRLLPPAGWSFAALDALNAVIGLAGAWALIGDFARGERRVAAFALLLLTPIYTLGAYKYDANTIFISLWPWATHAFVRALRTRTLVWSLAFGALVGVALLSKYFAALLLVACGLAALTSQEGRVWLRSASPWISAAVAATLLAPHAFWLAQTGAPPLRYLASVSGLSFAAAGRAALDAALGVAVEFLGVVAVVIYFARREAGAPRPARDPGLRMLVILGLGPLALTFLAGLALRVRLTAEMPIGALALIPLLAIEAARIDAGRGLARFSRRAAVAVVLAMTALSPVVMLARAYVGKNAVNAAPYEEAAEAVTRLWRERVGRPLAYVAGREYSHFTAFYSPDHPQAFFEFDYARNLWITAEKLARQGFAAVCAATDATCLTEAEALAAGRGERVEFSVSRRFLGHVGAPRAIVAWLVPPQP